MGWNIDTIEGFTKTEYLVSFIAIILAYITSEYFKGLGLLFRNRDHIRFPLSFLLFAFVSFIILTIYWWNMYDRSFQLETNFHSFLKILLYSLFFYLIANVLFSDLSKSDLADLDQYVFSRRKLLFSTLAAYFLYDQFASYIKDDRIFTIAGILICVIAAFAQNRTQLKILLITGTGIILVYLFISTVTNLFTKITPGKMPPFSKVEHLTIFISFIYGYVVAVYFKGWSVLIKDWKVLRFSSTQLLWTLFSFLILISEWWNSWIRSGYMADKLVYFQLSLVPPLILYTISLIIFPNKKEAKQIDLNLYFEGNRKTFFQLFLLYFIINSGLSFLFNETFFIGITVPFRLLATIFTFFALYIHNRVFQKVLPFVAIAIFIIYLVLND